MGKLGWLMSKTLIITSPPREGEAAGTKVSGPNLSPLRVQTTGCFVDALLLCSVDLDITDWTDCFT